MRSPARAEHRITLDEAIEMALRRNEEIIITRESVAGADGAARSARGAYDPVLEVEAAWSRSSQPVNSSFSGAPEGKAAPTNKGAEFGASIRQLLPTGGVLSVRGAGLRETTDGTSALLSPAYGTRLGVELRQPLLRDLTTDAARLAVRVSSAELEGAEAQLRRTVSDTVTEVEQRYWTLVAARLGIEVRQQAVQLAEEQLNETRSRIESGAVPETELAQPRAELERRRGDLLAEREALARAQNALKLLILDGADDPLWSEALDPIEETVIAIEPVDLATLQEQALSKRPELAFFEAAVRARRAETAFAKNAVWPSLDAVVSYERFGLAGSRNPAGPEDELPADWEGDLGTSFESLGDGDFDATRFALVLGLPIVNRTARGAAAVARSVEHQAEADFARARKTIRAEALDAAAALETAGQRIEAARAAREAAEVQLSAEQERYAVGLSTNFLVLTRQNDLSEARLDEISALTDYRTARTAVARATGSLIEDRGIEVGESAR
jgi:outer membrane protein TolC